MFWRSGAPIRTIRLAVVAGPAEQAAFAAVDARPVSAVPEDRAVPDAAPELSLHSIA